jgi:hypothetical protein
MEYLAAAPPLVMITQEAEPGRRKPRHMPNKAIDYPAESASEAESQKENVCWAVITANEILALRVSGSVLP